MPEAADAASRESRDSGPFVFVSFRLCRTVDAFFLRWLSRLSLSLFRTLFLSSFHEAAFLRGNAVVKELLSA